MNLYLLTSKEHLGYDTYTSVVVAAESEQAAKCIHPDGENIFNLEREQWGQVRYPYSSEMFESEMNIYSYKRLEYEEEFRSMRWHDRITWPKNLSNIDCKLIGTATKDIKSGVILYNFCAG